MNTQILPMTTIDYSIKEARQIAEKYCEATGTDENMIRGMIPGDALNSHCKMMMKVIDDLQEQANEARD